MPEFRVPLNFNLTTAIYLAVIYSTSRVDTALKNWQSEIRRMSPTEKTEYTEALNNVLEVTHTDNKLDYTHTPLVPHHPMAADYLVYP